MLKAQEAPKLFHGKSSLLAESDVSAFEESAAVHYFQLDQSIFGDKDEMSDDDHAVARTVEILSVVDYDTLNTETGEGSQVRRRDSIPMRTDKALANSRPRLGRWRHWQGKGGTQKLYSRNLGDDSVTQSRSDKSTCITPEYYRSLSTLIRNDIVVYYRNGQVRG